MADAASIDATSPTDDAREAPAKKPAKSPPPKRALSATLRSWTRTLHRDAGYLAVGLTFVYALSGIAVNHISQWDPNFRHGERTHSMGGPLAGEDEAIARTVAERLHITARPRDVYRVNESTLEVSYDRRTLHIDTARGTVRDEGDEPRLVLRAANWLHLNRGKKAWTYVADTYAVALLFLAISGLFMLPGRKGIFGRAGIMALLGAAIPIAYVHFAGP